VTYVLVVIASLTGTPLGSNTIVTFQEWSSLATCQAAKALIDHQPSSTPVVSRCIVK